MPISALPTPPSTASPSNFDARADAFLGALPTFVTEANTLAVTVDADKVASAASATNAAASATSASTSASSAAATAGVTKWISGTSYTQGDNVWSPTTFLTYRRKVTGGGTTDPSADTTNWAGIIPAPSAMVPLAVLTPTAAANVDFLTTFTSDYDNYLIIGNGIVGAASQQLIIQFANAGTVDTSSSYQVATGDSDAGAAATSMAITAQNIKTAGTGANFYMFVKNANATTQIKSVLVEGTLQDAASAYGRINRHGAYTTSSAASGVRFSLSGGANFTAQGKIRIYGIKNS